MRVVDHPLIPGVKCREDGTVWIPASGAHRAHWASGNALPSGYRQVTIAGKHRYVHRLICEAFHGLCPPDKAEVDHINRDISDNRPENLRWCNRSENSRNRKICEESLAKYGVASADDKKAYNRSLYANNPEFRERHKATARRCAKKKL